MGWQRPSSAGGNLGYTHVDQGALKYLDFLGCSSLLDVGCSTGGQVQTALKLGWGAFGIDVDETVMQGQQNIALINLAQNPVYFHKPFDVVWSVEVAEHIPREDEDFYVKTLTKNCDKYLVLTANQNEEIPGHVNCMPREYWIDLVEKHGLTYDESILQELLQHSTMVREFLETTGMVFKNESKNSK
jgi:SAM-dependent methyltransferase